MRHIEDVPQGGDDPVLFDPSVQRDHAWVTSMEQCTDAVAWDDRQDREICLFQYLIKRAAVHKVADRLAAW